jgi:uncharacterized protein (DUF1697 family)
VRYAVFLRGINVGGRNPVKMADLRAAFEHMGLQTARTVLASGNVVFEAGAEEGGAALSARIEAELPSIFGHPVGAIVRRLGDLEGLRASNPFGRVIMTPHTRLHITFLSDLDKDGTGIRPDPPKRIPAEIELVRLTCGEVLTATTLSAAWGTTELMVWLEKEFGPGVTTRNWNTIVKIVDGFTTSGKPTGPG